MLVRCPSSEEREGVKYFASGHTCDLLRVPDTPSSGNQVDISPEGATVNEVKGEIR